MYNSNYIGTIPKNQPQNMFCCFKLIRLFLYYLIDPYSFYTQSESNVLLDSGRRRKHSEQARKFKFKEVGT